MAKVKAAKVKGAKPLDVQAMGGAHDAASRFDRAMALWSPPIRSADADILPEKRIADARVSDSMRNDAYSYAGGQLHRNNVVGSLFRLNAKPNWRFLGLDETWAKEFAEEVENKFGLWAESFDNYPDAARRNTFTAGIRLAIGVYLAAGEYLETVEWVRDPYQPFRTCFQAIELARLSNPPSLANTGRTKGGVTLNSYGAPIIYHIRRSLPSGFDRFEDSHKWASIPVRNRLGRLQVIHVMEQNRPAQTRGMSQLVAALKTMKTTQSFRDVTLQNAVVNASYAAAITSELPTAQVFEALGGGNVSEAIVNYATSFLGAVSQYAQNARNMQVDGVRIPHLMPGTDLKLFPMGTPGGVGQDFESSLIRYIATALDVSFEQLSKDYRETNYSSARAGASETEKAMQARKRMVADRVASMRYALWLEEAISAGEITAMPRSAPDFYDPMARDAYSRAVWIGASRGQIDELKESQAAALRLTRGLTTYEHELSRLGFDWREVFAQRKVEKELMDELGIAPEEKSDAMNAATGTTRKPREDQDGEVEDE